MALSKLKIIGVAENRDTFFVRVKFKEQRDFSSLILLRRLFLLRTSAKYASILCPRFGVGSSFIFHLSSLLVPLAAAVARVVFQHGVGYVAVRENLNRAVVVA